jgi:hypothetical protein
MRQKLHGSNSGSTINHPSTSKIYNKKITEYDNQNKFQFKKSPDKLRTRFQITQNVKCIERRPIFYASRDKSEEPANIIVGRRHGKDHIQFSISIPFLLEIFVIIFNIQKTKFHQSTND